MKGSYKNSYMDRILNYSKNMLHSNLIEKAVIFFLFLDFFTEVPLTSRGTPVFRVTWFGRNAALYNLRAKRFTPLNFSPDKHVTKQLIWSFKATVNINLTTSQHRSRPTVRYTSTHSNTVLFNLHHITSVVFRSQFVNQDLATVT
jgi:hypothetical protein